MRKIIIILLLVVAYYVTYPYMNIEVVALDRALSMGCIELTAYLC